MARPYVQGRGSKRFRCNFAFPNLRMGNTRGCSLSANHAYLELSQSILSYVSEPEPEVVGSVHEPISRRRWHSVSDTKFKRLFCNLLEQKINGDVTSQSPICASQSPTQKRAFSVTNSQNVLSQSPTTVNSYLLLPRGTDCKYLLLCRYDLNIIRSGPI
jgi:hypothetical protein